MNEPPEEEVMARFPDGEAARRVVWMVAPGTGLAPA
jgi:hypothetical protein